MRWIQLYMALAVGCLAATGIVPLHSQEILESPEEQKERQAIERFLQILEKSPREGTALERVYAWHIEHGSLETLCETLHARQVEQSDGPAAFLLGLLQMRRGLESEAQVTLSAAESLLPDEPLVSYYLGQCLLMQGDLNAATAALQRAVEKHPGKAETLNILKELGRTYQRAQRTGEAIEVWQKMEGLYPGDLQVQEQIARVMAEEGADTEALMRFSALARATPDRFRQIEFAMQAAQLKLKLGQATEALTDYENLLGQVNPDSWLHQEIRSRIERHYLDRSDSKGLIDYYKQWLTRHPQDIEAMLRVGRLLSIQRQSDQAGQWFKQVIALAPSRVDAYLELSQALERDGQFGQAASVMQQLFTQTSGTADQDNADYLVRWGQLILADQAQPLPTRRQQAAEIWNQLLTARPDDPLTLTRVADLMRTAGLHERALELYRRCIAVAPDQQQYYEYLGEYLFRQGQKDQALAVWQAMVSGPRETADNLFRQAELLNQFGLTTEALAAMDKACQQRPTLSQRLRYIDKLIGLNRFDDAQQQIQLASKTAESDDEQNLVLEREISCLMASGLLKTETLKLQAIVSASEPPASASQWKRYALFLEAGGQPRLAALAIEQALQREPSSPQLLVIAARLYEQLGQLEPAIDALQRLLTIDRRQQLGLLMRIATMQWELGQSENAFKTAQQLMRSPGVGIEQVKFYADFCRQLGKEEEALTALRKYARLNSHDRSSLLILAQRLGDLFQTDEAIEFTWRALDQSNTLDERRDVVRALASYYQRLGKLKPLMARLDEYGRKTTRMREAALLKAHAWQTTEDYGLARQILEELNTDNQDVELLGSLVELAQAGEDFEAAARYQALINQAAPSGEGRLQLARYLLSVGEAEKAQQAWSEIKTSELTSAQLHSVLQQLILRDDYQRAAQLSEQVLAESPQDWEKLFLCAATLAIGENEQPLLRICEQLAQLNLPPDTRSQFAQSLSGNRAVASTASAQPNIRQSATATSSYSSYAQSMGLTGWLTTEDWKQHIRNLHAHDSAQRVTCIARALQMVESLILASNPQVRAVNGVSLSTYSSQLICYEDAKLFAQALIFLDKNSSAEPQSPDQSLPSVEQIAQQQDIASLWQSFFLASLAEGPRRQLFRGNFGNGTQFVLSMHNSQYGPIYMSETTELPPTSKSQAKDATLKRLQELGQVDADIIMLLEDLTALVANPTLLPNGTEAIGWSGAADVSDDELQRMISLLARAPDFIRGEGLVLSVINHGLFLRQLARERGLSAPQIDQAVIALGMMHPSYEMASILLPVDPSAACEVLITASQRQLQLAANSSNPGSLYKGNTEVVAKLVSEVIELPDAERHVTHLLKGLKRVQVEHARQLQPAQLAFCSPNQPLNLSLFQQNQQTVLTLDFPVPTAFLSGDLLMVIYMCQLNGSEQLSDQVGQVLALDQSSSQSDAYQTTVDRLAWATWKWWQGDPQAERECIELVTELKSVSPSTALAELLEYNLLIARGQYNEAIAQLEKLKETDPQLAIACELALFELQIRIGSMDKARLVAQRLLKLPLPIDKQLELLAFLDQLGVTPDSQRILRRAQRSRGQSIQTQLQVMQQFETAGQSEAAREVAREIVRATRSVLNPPPPSLTSLFSLSTASSDEADRNAREQAFKILADAPEIAQQISELEERVVKSPKSKILVTELAELYAATGNHRQAAQLRSSLRSSAPASANNQPAPKPGQAMRIDQFVIGELQRFTHDHEYIKQEMANFLTIVDTRSGWSVLCEQLGKLDYSQFPPDSSVLKSLIDQAASHITAVQANRVIGRLVDAKQARLLPSMVHAMDKRRAVLDASIAQRALDLIFERAQEQSLEDIFPRVTEADGSVRGWLSVVDRLIVHDDQAEELLDKAKHLHDAQGATRIDMQCLQVIMLLELGRVRQAQSVTDQLVSQGDDDPRWADPRWADPRWAWELASELCLEYQQYDLAIGLLKPWADKQPAAVDLSVPSIQLLLMECYRRDQDKSNYKRMLDAALTTELQRLKNRSAGPASLKSLPEIVDRYAKEGWEWEAYVANFRAYHPLINRQLNGTQDHQLFAALQFNHKRYELQLTADKLITALAQEAHPRQPSSPTAVPIELLVPTFAQLDMSLRQLKCPLTEGVWWLSRTSADTRSSQEVLRLAVENASDLSITSLIAMFHLADKLAQPQAALQLIDRLQPKLQLWQREARQRESAQGSSLEELASDRRTRAALWIVAQRLVTSDQPAMLKNIVQFARSNSRSDLVQDLHCQLCVANSLVQRQQLGMAEEMLKEAFVQLQSLERKDHLPHVQLALALSSLAGQCHAHRLSLDAFSHIFDSGTMQHLLLTKSTAGHITFHASAARSSPDTTMEKQFLDARQLVFKQLFDLLATWESEQVDPNLIVDTLQKCILPPELPSEIRLVPDAIETSSDTRGAFSTRTSRASQLLQSRSANYNLNVASALQKFKQPPQIRYLAFSLVDWAHRAGRLPAVIEEVQGRLQRAPQAEGRGLLIYAMQAAGQRDQVKLQIDQLVDSEMTNLTRLDAVLQAVLMSSPSVPDGLLTDATLDRFMHKVMDLDLVTAAPYCQQMVLQAINAGDTARFTRLGEFLCEYCRDASRADVNGLRSHHEYLLLSEIYSQAAKANRHYMTLGILGRMQELSRGDKASMRNKLAAQAQQALLKLCQLPEEERYEVASSVLLGPGQLSVDAMQMHYVPPTGIPPWAWTEASATTLTSLRPYPDSHTISLLDVLLNGAEQRGQLDAVLDHLQASLSSKVNVDESSAQRLNTRRLHPPTQADLRLLDTWIRLRCEYRKSPLPVKAQELEKSLSPEIRPADQQSFISWLLWLPEAAQCEVFEHCQRLNQLPDGVRLQLEQLLANKPETWRDCMRGILLRALATHNSGESVERLRHWQTSDRLNSAENQLPGAPLTWKITPDHQLLSGLGPHCLFLNIPLEGDVLLGFDAQVTHASPTNNFGCMLNGLGIRYRDRADLTRRDGPAALIHWLSSRSEREWQIPVINKPDETRLVRQFSVQRKADVMTVTVDGTEVARHQFASRSFPFVGLYPPGRENQLTNVRIVGKPATKIELLDQTLGGWHARRYDSQLPDLLSQSSTADPPIISAQVGTSGLDWYVIENELHHKIEVPDFSNATKDKLRATHCYLEYARPLQDGDVIEYEVFGESAESLPAPCVGWCAMLVEDEQIKMHWLPVQTDVAIDPDLLRRRSLPPNSQQLSAVKPREGEWNKVKLRLEGQVITLSFNDNDVFRYSVESAVDHRFGWYCDQVKTRVRIRQATLQGRWPQSLPENLWEKF